MLCQEVRVAGRAKNDYYARSFFAPPENEGLGGNLEETEGN
jgi:hypothetical protein